MEIILGLTIVVFLLLAATSYNSFTSFNKEFLIEDLKMVMDSVVATPGEVKVTYDINGRYGLKMEEDNIKVEEDPLQDKELLVLEYSAWNDKGDKRWPEPVREAKEE